MVTPAVRTTSILLVFLNLTNDKFKIIITLRRAQKFGDQNLEIWDPIEISIFCIAH